MYDGQTVYNSGHATFLDSAGQLVLYTDIRRVYNKYHYTMQNGTMMLVGGWLGNAIVKIDNSDDIWVITRKFEEDAFAAFLIDENGFHTDPVISEIPDRVVESATHRSELETILRHPM